MMSQLFRHLFIASIKLPIPIVSKASPSRARIPTIVRVFILQSFTDGDKLQKNRLLRVKDFDFEILYLHLLYRQTIPFGEGGEG